MLIYSFITDYQAFSLRYKDNTTRDKNETKVGKQSANLGKNNEPIQNRLSFLTDCKSVILHHLTILSFPMVRPAWDNWWLLVAIFGIAWMGDTFFNGNLDFFKGHIATIVTQYPFLFAIALFIMSIMLFSQAATVRTLYPLGIGLGISPLALIAMFPAVNGYFFLPNYPTTVAAINFDRTGSTGIGRFVVNHSFQLAGFITTFVSIGVGYLIIQFL